MYFNDANSNYVGIIGFLMQDKTVKNVHVKNGYIKGESSVGAICGYCLGTVESCSSDITVSSTSIDTGGICGYGGSDSTIKNCLNTGAVTGSNYVGGICGYDTDGKIENCLSTGTVHNTSSSSTNLPKVGSICGTIPDKAVYTNNYYLSGTATDVNGVIQNGIGAASTGSITADPAGITAISSDKLSTGELCLLLNQNNAGGWYQNLREAIDNTPVPDSTHEQVYFEETLNFYSNYPAPALSDNYYQLDSADDLFWFADAVNYEHLGINGILTENIDLNPGYVFDENGIVSGGRTPSAWKPIADFVNIDMFYTGVFDGNDKTISGVYINQNWRNGRGLFSQSNGTIKNVSIVNSYIRGNTDVGGVCSFNNKGLITDCFSSAIVKGEYNVGGVCGNNYEGSIKNCNYNGIAWGTSKNAGGICGNNSNTISNCHSSGIVWGYSIFGGVCGQNYGTISHCTNSGTVSGRYYVGGICGTDFNEISNCINSGVVSGYQNVGGVCGSLHYEQKYTATVSYCYNTGKVTENDSNGTAKGHSAGIVGETVKEDFYGQIGNVTVTNCYYLFTSATCGMNANITGDDANVSPSGQAEAKTQAQFNSGEVAYLLNGGKIDGTQVWFQTCGEGYPEYSGETVYHGYGDYDADGFAELKYANSPLNEFEYEPAETISETNYEKYSFTAENWSGYKDYYALDNAGNLYWFAKHVNGSNQSANAVLTKNITLNDETFTFEPDTGLVKVTDGTNTAYLGTGMKGDNSGDDARFDTSASEAGQCYIVDGGAYTTESAVYSGSIRVWTPIANTTGTTEYKYSGIFDGNGKTVSGLYINNDYKYAGLFGSSSGTVKNVGVINSYSYNKQTTGGIIASNYGTVTGCYNAGTVVGNIQVGGVVGRTGQGNVESCYNTGAVSGVGIVGGVVGHNYSNSVKSCYNTGAVSGSSSAVGGVVGGNQSGSVESCHNTGSVSGSQCIGGVVGANSVDLIKSCYNTGAVSGITVVGGVVGESGLGSIESCYNTGSVSGSEWIGGVAGYAGNVSIEGGTVASCYNTGAVSGNTEVGGVVGCKEASVTVTNCYYLSGCATYVDGTVQFGIGGTTADTAGSTAVMTEAQFHSGEVTYLLNGKLSAGTDKDPLVWFQNVGAGYPSLDSTLGTVYYGYGAYDGDGFAELEYANRPRNESEYEPANYTDNRYDVDYDGEMDSVYEIGNAGQLYWFAKYVNSYNESANAILMGSIKLNDETFTFDHDTGLVKVTDGKNTAYLGTGIKGVVGPPTAHSLTLPQAKPGGGTSLSATNIRQTMPSTAAHCACGRRLPILPVITNIYTAVFSTAETTPSAAYI